MISRIPFLILLACCLSLVAGCGDSEKSAQQALEEKQYAFSVDDYLQAARNGDLASLKLFLEAGMEVDSPDARGNTALMRAAGSGQADVVEALLKAGADPLLANANRRTALIAAADSGHVDVSRSLLNRGADMTAKDIEGWNALNLAAYNGHSTLVEMLAGKVDQEALDSALLISCFRGGTAVIDQLLNHGAYVNTRSPTNQTPLMIAAQGGHSDAVKLLLQNQANPFALDDGENTAADLAVGNGYSDLHDLLLDPTAHLTDNDLGGIPNRESDAARALDALEGGTSDLLGDKPEMGEKPMAAINGAVLKSPGGAQSLRFDSYREEPLPVMLKGVESGSAEVRVLSRRDATPVQVKAGEVIPNTRLRVTDVSTRFVNSKQGKGELVDVSRITVENTETGARHMLVKDVPGRSTDTYAVLTMPGSSYRYAVKKGDVFRAVMADKNEEDFRVLEIRPTQVIVKSIETEEVLTIDRGGIAMQ